MYQKYRWCSDAKLCNCRSSIFARFGFSDILTCLLALDAYVELYHEGTIPLSEFAARPVRRDQKDILVRIIIKKDGRKAAYTSQRNSRTDFPVIACCVSNLGNKWFVSVGARPAKAKTVIITEDDFDTLKEMAKQAQMPLLMVTMCVPAVLIERLWQQYISAVLWSRSKEGAWAEYETFISFKWKTGTGRGAPGYGAP